MGVEGCPSWMKRPKIYSLLGVRHLIKVNQGENASHSAEIENGVYGANSVIDNYVQFWFRRFHSGIFDINDAPHSSKSVVENVDKITEIIEAHRYVSSRNNAQELKINHKTVLNHLRKVGLKKKPDIWVQHQLTPKKHDLSNFHLRSLVQTERNRPIS
ncbi:histone-lysine N-methyltransferase SETMAR [Trichonephila clavipes]|nr:histone-lysine N-methyltransferase SETMAR [Trichonephila clavipes]